MTLQLVVTADTKDLLLRVSGCGGHPCRSQTALTECCVVPKLGERCIMHSCASKIKQMPQGTSSVVDTADGHGGTRKPNPVVSAMTSVLLKCYKSQQSHAVPAGGAVQPSLCLQETQCPRDTPSLLRPGPWEKVPAASSCVQFWIFVFKQIFYFLILVLRISLSWRTKMFASLPDETKGRYQILELPMN